MLRLLKGERAEISADQVHRNLGKLQKGMAELNADLYINNRPVRPSRIDISIHVTRKQERDWFEIAPEIRFNGQILPNEEWESVLTSSGMVEKAEAIYLVPPEAISALGNFTKFIKRRRSPMTLNKNIVDIPRLEILEWITLKKLGIHVNLPEEDERIIQRLFDFTKIEKKDLAEKFCGNLKDYQKEGYDWLAFHYEHRLGACLADDTGLGKTIQSIAFLAGIKEGKFQTPFQELGKPHLIVMTPTLFSNWKKEIEKFYPDFKIEIYSGNDRQLEADIILISYDSLIRNITALEKISFHVMIFDEAQKVKNIYSARTNAARRLKGDFKICLTATPIENHTGEYFSIMDLCVPGLLNKAAVFRKDFKISPEDYLIQRTRPFVLRRTKKVLEELPTKTESEAYLELTKSQKLVYAKVAESVRQAIEEAYAKNRMSLAGIIAVQALVRLRLICISEKLINPASLERSPKINYLIEKLLQLQKTNEAALVFSQFTTALDILETELKREQIPYCRMDGKMPIEQRGPLVDAFQRGTAPPVFLISRGTGGVGLNLTRASHVFHLDPWWNPAVDRQASDRVHRIGQEKPVFVHHLIMRHTLEEKIMDLRKEKNELFNVILNPGKAEQQENKLTKEFYCSLLAA